MSEPPSSTSNHRAGQVDGRGEPSLVDGLRGWLKAIVRRRNGEASVREAIEDLIEEHEETEVSIEAGERELISNILALHDLSVGDVMVPRAEIVAVDIDTSMEELVALMGKEAHSRLPVFRGSLDEVLGMVHIKDVLVSFDRDKPARLAELVREILFVAPSMRVLDLLLEMRQNRVHMAIIVDEFGGVDGLVSIEDLVEEIVGEIEDEHDEEEAPRLALRPDGTLLADARTPVEEFEQVTGPVLDAEEREEVETLGGLVFRLIDRVPRRGEIISHPSGIEFEILDADPRRVRRLRVRNLPANVAAEAGD